MDTKEALKILRSHPVWCTAYPAQKCDEATDLAISALEKVSVLEVENAMFREKETPKEPISDGNYFDCPDCNGYVNPLNDYCGNCGRKLAHFKKQAIKIDKE